MQFVDANILVKAFTNNEDADKCKQILLSEFIVDTLSLVEAFGAITIIKNNKYEAADCIRSLFKTQGIIVDLDRNIIFETFKRLNKYNLKIFDLIHYTTALINNCSEIVSYDKDFDNLEIKRIEP